MIKLLPSLIKADRLFSVNYICDVGIKALVTMNTTVSLLTTGAAKQCLKREVNETEINDDVCAEKIVCTDDRMKKKKYAMLLAYCGQGYYGLQRNQGTKTIEEELLIAMRNCRLITEDAFSRPQLIHFQRAARTDKSVSALRQVLSMKLPEKVDVSDINKELPEQIRVIALRRTTKGFNSKIHCDARTYSYTLPTFALAPHSLPISEDYRASADDIEKVNSILKMYEGTHNFHNFTSKVLALDPRARRYMIKLSCESKFLKDGMEFAVIKVKGQSFMLHQIRKMVGLVIAIVRGLVTSDVVFKAYDLEKIDIPMAPGVGLLLEEVHYDRYNVRFGEDGIHEPLDWSAYEENIEALRQKYIFPVVLSSEKIEKSMITWLETLHLHSFDVRERHLHEEQNDEEDDGQTLSDGEDDADCNKVRKQNMNSKRLRNSKQQENSTQQVNSTQLIDSTQQENAVQQVNSTQLRDSTQLMENSTQQVNSTQLTGNSTQLIDSTKQENAVQQVNSTQLRDSTQLIDSTQENEVQQVNSTNSTRIQ